MASTEKKVRWRKDKKDAPESIEPSTPALSSTPAGFPAAENQAASQAFRGLHGRRSELALVSGAVDSAYQTVLGGNAHYYRELICQEHDYTMYEALAKELDYTDVWMSGGTKLYRPTALGGEEALRKSPTYERVLRFLAGYFGIEPLRSLVNHYRNGDDYTAFHSDQYFSGMNMTIGASFGDERLLVFEHKISKEQFNFPQHNGDIFAFTDEVNNQFTHAIPKERRRAHSASRGRTPGRVSVIIFGRRQQPEWKQLAATRPLNLLPFPHVTTRDPNAVEEEKEVVEGPLGSSPAVARATSTAGDHQGQPPVTAEVGETAKVDADTAPGPRDERRPGRARGGWNRARA